MPRTCPDCGHDNLSHEGEVQNYYGNNHTIHVKECPRCGWTNKPNPPSS